MRWQIPLGSRPALGFGLVLPSAAGPEHWRWLKLDLEFAFDSELVTDFVPRPRIARRRK